MAFRKSYLQLRYGIGWAYNGRQDALEEFLDDVTEELSRQLVEVFTDCRRDATLKQADIVTRLKETMEDALRTEDDAAD
jgi:hypothetical protein